jgi:internalin A
MEMAPLRFLSRLSVPPLSKGIAMRFSALVAALFSLGLVSPLVAQESIFPDKNLEKVVRQYVFEKRNNEQPIVEKDVESISTIVGKKKGITNLAGLEKCKSLALLDLEGNEIADIAAIKDLKQIQSLNLANNKIADIGAVAELKALQYLELSGNQVKDLAPLAKLENMRSLYLSKNQIEDLGPVGGLAKLWSLYLDGNKISNLDPIANLKKLETLDLTENQVSNLAPLAAMTEFDFLLLGKNQITDVAVLVDMCKKDLEGKKRFAPFVRLYLEGNPLSDAGKAQVEELTKLGVRIDPK